MQDDLKLEEPASPCQPRAWWLLALLPLFLLGQWHGFEGVDEPREAELAREMVASGDWVTPRLNGRPFLEKPPLLYWMTAAVFHAAGGASEKLCRIPVALLGILGSLAAFWLGSGIGGRSAGILSALVLATCFQWFQVHHVLITDVPLATGVAGSLALFWFGYSSGGPWRKRLGYAGCAAAAALAVLAKGAVGLALPGIAVFAFLAWRREWREMLRVLAPWNLAAFLAVAVPWFAALRAWGPPDAFHTLFWDNLVLRFFSGRTDHAAPPWFYLDKILTVHLPWTLLFPPAFALLARRGEPGPGRAGRQFVLAGTLAPLLLLSVASGKRELYLLPLMPLFAVAAGLWLARPWAEAARWERIWRAASFALLAFFAAGAWIYSLVVALLAGGPWLAASSAAGLAVCTAVCAAATFRVLKTRGESSAALAAVVALAAAGSLLSPAVRSELHARRSYDALEALLDGTLAPGDALHGHRLIERLQGAAAFHRGAVVPEAGDAPAIAALLRDSPRNVVLMEDVHRQRMEAEGVWPPEAVVAARAELDHRTLVLIRRKE